MVNNLHVLLLHISEKHTVIGYGSPNSTLFYIGNFQLM